VQSKRVDVKEVMSRMVMISKSQGELEGKEGLINGY
jgi:hypothetical protein